MEDTAKAHGSHSEGRQTEVIRTWECGDYKVDTIVDAEGKAGFQVSRPWQGDVYVRESFGDTRTRMSHLAQTLMAARQTMLDDQFDLDLWPDSDTDDVDGADSVR